MYIDAISYFANALPAKSKHAGATPDHVTESGRLSLEALDAARYDSPPPYPQASHAPAVPSIVVDEDVS
jgi:hypothetical protein